MTIMQAELPPKIAAVYVTDELSKRPPSSPDHLKEKNALQDIATLMVTDPGQVLPRLVDLSMELCGAVAGGISIYEESDQVFRWHHLRGSLQRFTGATTPRNYSPCGITLDRKSTVLVQRPERAYSWLVDADVSLPECLLVPLFVGGTEPLGTLWIVSADVGHFTEGHSRTLTEIASFAGIALHMLRAEDRLKIALEQQETLTKEMGHRVKNLFAIVDGMIRMSARGSTTTEEMATSLSGRVHALSDANALVRRAFDADGRRRESSDLKEVVSAILRPYGYATTSATGPDIRLGERATNAVALIFHELATNASKYGSLGAERGRVSVNWANAERVVALRWTETGGPAVESPPEKLGFGSKLVGSTVASLGGSIAYDWNPSGVEVAISLPEASLAS